MVYLCDCISASKMDEWLVSHGATNINIKLEYLRSQILKVAMVKTAYSRNPQGAKGTIGVICSGTGIRERYQGSL
jgi:hypothetical protein